ncbi:PREDICTED: uncharacterized protein LOC105449346 [Wasmannia auropunctata]|uniref:uncharacterized protein LOC105449346 n=1 Tax=Wasmannia auropunctata TaxID=64793 RepID=UPI0005EE7905|nr:PREDICTED: uncharacterized protein LOC105449346 [Wasmannia auropunctata]
MLIKSQLLKDWNIGRIRKSDEMALETPWLNLNFVEKILQKSESDNTIQMIDIFSKPATSKGDNYTSDMIRITAEFSRDLSGRKIIEKKSIIVKISPTLENIIRYKLVSWFNLYNVFDRGEG